jgi:putative transposase
MPSSRAWNLVFVQRRRNFSRTFTCNIFRKNTPDYLGLFFIDICHETVRFWVERFGAKFARKIRKKRAGQHSNWQWHLDEVFVKINGERFYLWRAVDHEGEVPECYVTRRRNKAAAKKFLIKAMRKHGSPKIITTDKLPSFGAAFREIGIADKQL